MMVGKTMKLFLKMSDNKKKNKNKMKSDNNIIRGSENNTKTTMEENGKDDKKGQMKVLILGDS